MANFAQERGHLFHLVDSAVGDQKHPSVPRWIHSHSLVRMPKGWRWAIQRGSRSAQDGLVEGLAVVGAAESGRNSSKLLDNAAAGHENPLPQY